MLLGLLETLLLLLARLLLALRAEVMGIGHVGIEQAPPDRPSKSRDQCATPRANGREGSKEIIEAISVHVKSPRCGDRSGSATKSTRRGSIRPHRHHIRSRTTSPRPGTGHEGARRTTVHPTLVIVPLPER